MTLPQLPSSPRVLVSALFFYCDELGPDFIRRVKPQLEFAAHDLGASVHLRISLNYPDPAPSWDTLLGTYAPDLPDGVSIDIIRNGRNLGFGRGHNRVFESRPSDVFIVINSDLFCTDLDWISRGVRKLSDSSNGLVGARENASWLRRDGCGIQVTDTSQHHDFVDGSLLFIKSEAARRLGLFSEDFQLFYFEDVDLCLRFQQAGLAVAIVPLPHEHLRSASSKRVPRYLVQAVLEENRERFFRKWGEFLERRSLSRSIVIDLRETPDSLVCAAIPTVIALRRQHPTAEITIVHACHADRSLLGILGCTLSTDLPSGTSDRCASWSVTTDFPHLPPVLAFARAAGVELDLGIMSRELRIAVRHAVPTSTPCSSQRAVIHFASPPRKFDGLVPDARVFAQTADRLVRLGYEVEGIADAEILPHLDWFSKSHRLSKVAENAVGCARQLLDCSLVVSPDSCLLLLSQLLNVRCVGYFGPTSALRSVFAWSNTGVASPPGLDCLGCNHRFGLSTHNYCIRRDLACTSPEYGDTLAEAVEKFIRTGQSDIGNAVSIENRLALRPRRASLDLDLSAWPPE